MMILDAHKLTYIKQSKTFCCEASDLDLPPLRFAGNVVIIKNFKTGRSRKFFYERAVMYGPKDEPEIGHWLYRTLNDNIEFHLFND